MHRNQIVEELNYIMEVKRYDGKMTKFENPVGKVVKYAAASSIGLVGIGLVALYRHYTDLCRKACGGDQLCFNNCYLESTEKVIVKIQSDIQKVNAMPASIPKELKKKESKLKKLNTELLLWTSRRMKYKNKILRLSKKKKYQP